MQTENRVAIAAGGAGGLGQAMVRRFVADGLRVAVADLDGAAAGARAGELDGAIGVEVDVSAADSAARLAVAWLASPRCSFSTGAGFDLSGGRASY